MNQRELMTKYGQIWKIGSCVYEILEPFLFKLDTLYIFCEHIEPNHTTNLHFSTFLFNADLRGSWESNVNMCSSNPFFASAVSLPTLPLQFSVQICKKM